MQTFGERLGEPVGQRFGHDRVVVVVLGPEALTDLVQADARRDGEGADMVAQARLGGRDEVGQRTARMIRAPIHLLTQEMQGREDGGAVGARVGLDVVADRVRGEEAVNAPGLQQPLLDDAIEQRIPLVEDLLRLRAVLFVFQNLRIDALQLPRVEERRPVDVLPQRPQREVVEHAHTRELGLRHVVRRPRDRGAAGARRLEAHQRLARTTRGCGGSRRSRPCAARRTHPCRPRSARLVVTGTARLASSTWTTGWL